MLTDWISKSAEVRFKLPFEEAIAARLSMEDAEWAFYEPFSIAIGGRGGRPASDRRRIPDAVFRIARTGSPWRDPPEEFGVWSSVYRRFRRRMPAGLWETTPEALNESGAMPGSGSNDRLSSVPIIWRRAQRGARKQGSGRSKRRLYDQKPPHCQRSRIACQGGNDRPLISKASMPWLTMIRQMPKRFRPTAVTTAITFARQSPDAQAHRSLRERPIVKSQFGSMR